MFTSAGTQMPPLTEDPDFYYRVDSHTGLRAVCSDDIFRPARWPHDGSGWQHVALINEAQDIQNHEAIYRISFWENEDEARKDLAVRGSSQPHVMLRVSRYAVAEALGGWTFGDDDFLSGRAALIWQRTARTGDRFCDRGVPLDQFEVWESNGWRPWIQAETVQPDRVRLARAGWLPLALVTRQGPAIAYWCIAQVGNQSCPNPWVVLTLDENSPGNLGGELGAVRQAATLLLTGPLRMVAHDLGGILTVHVTKDRLWTEHYAVSCTEAPSSSILGRLLRIEAPQQIWNVECEWLLRNSQEHALIRNSGLRAARPEALDSAWQAKAY